MFVYVRMFVYVCVCMCLYVCVNVCVYAYISVCVYTCTYVTRFAKSCLPHTQLKNVHFSLPFDMYSNRLITNTFIHQSFTVSLTLGGSKESTSAFSCI